LKTPVKTLRRYRTIDTQTWLDAIHNTREQH